MDDEVSPEVRSVIFNFDATLREQLAQWVDWANHLSDAGRNLVGELLEATLNDALILFRSGRPKLAEAQVDPETREVLDQIQAEVFAEDLGVYYVSVMPQIAELLQPIARAIRALPQPRSAVRAFEEMIASVRAVLDGIA